MSTSPISLPPGATLVSDGAQPPMKLPPGATLVSGGVPSKREIEPEDHEGFLGAVGSDLAGAAKGIAMAGPVGIAYQSLKHAYDNYHSVKATGKTLEQQQSESEKAAGYGPAYRALAPAAQAVGANVPAMEQDAAKGDTAGVLGHAAVPTAMALSPLIAEGAIRGAGKIADAIPSKAAAGKLFQDVAKDANKVPVSLNASQDAALKLVDWQKKTQLGPTLNKFLNRITNPKLGPMDYEEARDFQQLISELSTGEKMRLSGPIKFEVNRLAAGLKTDIGNAASQVGRGADYTKAMQDYHDAARISDAVDGIKDVATKELIKGALRGIGYGAGGYAAYKLIFNH